MLKEELRVLFNYDLESKSISNELFRKFDDAILSCVDENNFQPEILMVYKKFVSMKQNAPDSMKKNLFSTIRNFINAQINSERILEALVLFRFLLAKTELLPQELFSIAELTGQLNLKNIAIDFAQIYEQKENNLPLLYINLGSFYKNIKKNSKKSIKYYEEFIKIDKNKPVLYIILADLYAKEYGDYSLKEQIYYYKEAEKFKPSDRLILHGLAFCYEKLGDKDAARQYYESIMRQTPSEIDFYNYGMFLISCGEFQKGHQFFTHRFNINDTNLKYPFDINKKWDFKTNISDKTLLVHYEQGFGDTFMYSRFVPLLKDKVKKVIFVVQNELFDLINESPKISSGVEIHSDEEDLSKLEYDYSVALLDLPYILGTEPANIPFAEGYLEVSQEKINEYFYENLNDNYGLKIGIAFSGDKNANYEGRDVNIEKFNILKNIKGVKLYSLQKDAPESSGIIALGKTFTDFSQTACAIKNMDIIVSTDNVILNLAGALGAKTFGLFNKQTNFRWFNTSRENVGWYTSVKPIQAKEQNEWAEVFLKLSDSLNNLMH